MYQYNAVVTSVHDGNTLSGDIDLGFATWLRNRPMRLRGISALELSMVGGPETTTEVRAIIAAVGPNIVIRSYKVDHDPDDNKSFERYVVVVTLADGRDLGATLVANGWAVPWNGRTKPTPYPAWPRQAKLPNGKPPLG